MAHRQRQPGQQQLHVPMGVFGLLQHALGVYPYLRHLHCVGRRLRRFQSQERAGFRKEDELILPSPLLEINLWD